MRKNPLRLSALVAAVATLLSVALVQPASADSTVLFDEATAQGRCLTSYPGTSGQDPLSPCQWDLSLIHI